MGLGNYVVTVIPSLFISYQSRLHCVPSFTEEGELKMAKLFLANCQKLCEYMFVCHILYMYAEVPAIQERLRFQLSAKIGIPRELGFPISV
jgi:hypothetical protein